MKLSAEFNTFVNRKVTVHTREEKYTYNGEEHIEIVGTIDRNDKTMKALFALAAKSGYTTRVFIAPSQMIGTADYRMDRLNITLKPTNTNNFTDYKITGLNLG